MTHTARVISDRLRSQTMTNDDKKALCGIRKTRIDSDPISGHIEIETRTLCGEDTCSDECYKDWLFCPYCGKEIEQTYARPPQAVRDYDGGCEVNNYRKKNLQPMFPWGPNMATNELISISEADRLNGSPKIGDMVAVNPKDATDMWLVAEDYFIENYELVEDQP